MLKRIGAVVAILLGVGVVARMAFVGSEPNLHGAPGYVAPLPAPGTFTYSPPARDPGLGQGSDPKAKTVCRQLATLYDSARKQQAPSPAELKIIRGWKNLRVRSHSYIQADAQFIYDDAFNSGGLTFEQIKSDIGQMRRDCGTAGYS